MEKNVKEGENPVHVEGLHVRYSITESRTLDMVCKMGGNFHLKLNIGLRPIANKYREGKMKRTLERELKVPEIAKKEANGTSFFA